MKDSQELEGSDTYACFVCKRPFEVNDEVSAKDENHFAFSGPNDLVHRCCLGTTDKISKEDKTGYLHHRIVMNIDEGDGNSGKKLEFASTHMVQVKRSYINRRTIVCCVVVALFVIAMCVVYVYFVEPDYQRPEDKPKIVKEVASLESSEPTYDQLKPTTLA